jgi:2-polyprenyl-3-methyl-5-hydroxy-6-metoxy-1,4-benzoquinol methylase
VGCGSGAGIHAATELGWDAIGIDINQELIELGKKQLGANLLCCDLLESNLEQNQFHFIRLRDVIEHLPNPYAVLVEVEKLLAPGGIGLIVTPNEAGLPNQIRLLLGMKRKLVASVAPPHHLHGFTPKTLKRIIERSGLQTIEVKTTTPVNSLYVTASNMQSAGNKPFVLIWRVARAIGRGSVLIAWVKKR